MAHQNGREQLRLSSNKGRQVRLLARRNSDYLAPAVGRSYVENLILSSTIRCYDPRQLRTKTEYLVQGSCGIGYLRRLGRATRDFHRGECGG